MNTLRGLKVLLVDKRHLFNDRGAIAEDVSQVLQRFTDLQCLDIGEGTVTLDQVRALQNFVPRAAVLCDTDHGAEVAQQAIHAPKSTRQSASRPD